MADDNTTIFTPPELQGGAVKEHNGESYLFQRNLSGRFWVAIVAVVGTVIITVMIFAGWTKLESNTAMAIYSAFCAGTLSLASTYMGQNSKPTKVDEGGNGK
jgi:hypothetical protein